MSSLFCKKLKFCLFFLFFYCIGAAFAQEPGKLSLDSRYTISNINVRQFSFPPASDIDRVELDMEIHKLDFDFRYGLNEKMDLELSVPYLIFWEGFLDSAIDFFEDTLGVKPPSSRGDRGTNRYRYFLRVNSETLIDRESGDGGFGDTTLQWAWTAVWYRDFSAWNTFLIKGFLSSFSRG